MTVDLVTVEAGDTITSAGRRTEGADVRPLPVREGDAIVGLVSQRDVLAVLVGAADG